jgi:hypothetical protein
MQESNVSLAIKLLGGPSDVARRAGLKTAWGVSKWREALPADRVLWLSEETGWRFSPHELAPERYPHADDGLPEELRGLTAEDRRGAGAGYCDADPRGLRGPAAGRRARTAEALPRPGPAPPADARVSMNEPNAETFGQDAMTKLATPEDVAANTASVRASVGWIDRLAEREALRINAVSDRSRTRRPQCRPDSPLQLAAGRSPLSTIRTALGSFARTLLSAAGWPRR